MRSIGGSSTHLLLKLLLIYGSVSFSSSLRLPRSVHRNLPWGNLSPLPPSCSGLLWRRRLIHSTWCYFAGAVLIWYTVSRLWQHVTENLATQAAFVLRLCLRLPFLFCSLAGFHLESTSNSLGATSLWPAGLPNAFKYIYIYNCIYIYIIVYIYIYNKPRQGRETYNRAR